MLTICIEQSSFIFIVLLSRFINLGLSDYKYTQQEELYRKDLLLIIVTPPS